MIRAGSAGVPSAMAAIQAAWSRRGRLHHKIVMRGSGKTVERALPGVFIISVRYEASAGEQRSHAPARFKCGVAEFRPAVIWRAEFHEAE